MNPIIASWSISGDEDERPTEEVTHLVLEDLDAVLHLGRQEPQARRQQGLGPHEEQALGRARRITSRQGEQGVTEA